MVSRVVFPPQGRPWKRADVTTGILLHAIDKWGVNALDMLRMLYQIPVKVLVQAVHRETARKTINWGISPWRPFLDVEGQRIVREAKETRRVNSQGGRGRAVRTETTLQNGMVLHSRGGDTSSHAPTIRCTMCPTEVETAVQPSGTWKVSAWFADPTTGAIETHEVTSTPDVVAAWMRALADRAAPPRPVTRTRDIGPEGHRRGGPFSASR